MDAHVPLRHCKEKWVDPDVGYEGDAGTGDVAYDADAEVCGGRRGELLTWGSNNDGLPLDNRLMQADGVRLELVHPEGQGRALGRGSSPWSRRRSGWCETQPGRVHGRRRHGGVRRPPAADRRHRQLRGLLLPVPAAARVAAPLRAGRPRSPADQGGGQLATELQGRHNVVSVTLEPGAATLDGKPADRLTWVVVRPHRTWDGPAGTWRLVTIARDDLHVTWGATPAEWLRESDDFTAFVRSVRLGPARP